MDTRISLFALGTIEFPGLTDEPCGQEKAQVTAQK
jgi:hypothetical protein